MSNIIEFFERNVNTEIETLKLSLCTSQSYISYLLWHQLKQ